MRKSAFTLVEFLVVLVILGIVAALTIPVVIRRQIESANRTKIKKVMKVYDMLLNKMALENDLKSTKALKDWANCINTSNYFKPVKYSVSKNGVENGGSPDPV